MSFNLFLLTGRLTKDPFFQTRDRKNGEGQYSQACYTVVNVQRNKDGTAAEKFFDIDVFGQNAMDAKEYLRQGSQVTLRGALGSSPYTSRRGETLNTLNLQVYEQESPDIPEREPTGAMQGPEASHELPERSGTSQEEAYDLAEQSYFQ